MSHTARRKDEILDAARRETARKITDLETEINTLTAQLQATNAVLAESKREGAIVIRLQDKTNALQL